MTSSQDSAGDPGTPLYRDLVETSQDIIFSVDIHGTVTFVNRAVESILGWKPEEVIGQPFTVHLAPEHADADMTSFERNVGGEDVYRYETTIKDRHGELVELSVNSIVARDESGEVVGITGTARDISARAAAEGAVREAEAKYRGLVERLPAITFICEPGREGYFHYVSPQVEEILGYTPEEWMAEPTTWASRLHPDDRDRVLAEEDLAIENGPGVSESSDYRMIARDGSVVWIRDEATLDDSDGQLLWRGLFFDITDMKRAEIELGRRAAQQEVVARLGERALRGMTLAGLMAEAVNSAVRVLDIECANVLELAADFESLTVAAAVGWPEDSIEGLRVPATSRSLAGRAMNSHDPVIVEDWSLTSGLDRPPMFEQRGLRSALAVRIEGPAGPFGVLEMHARERGRFGFGDVSFVHAVGNVLADAIERRASEDEIRHQALHDPLTGLPNRVLFLDRLGHALARSSRQGSPVGVLFLDLDNFKLVNDTLGHQAGDELLVAVAPRLNQSLRPSDTVARFGGDEFGVLVEDISEEADAIRVAERIAAAFARPFIVGGTEHFVTASVGIALARDGGESPQALIRDADAAMYRAKDRGRARYELFDQVMRARAVERLATENDLRRALEREELRVHYQPIVSMRDNTLHAVEALVRWQHPERGMLEPDDFIQIAEDSGLIEGLGTWVLGEACRQGAEWQQLRPDAAPLNVFVNLSARQLGMRGFREEVIRALRHSGLQAQCLHLELTESQLLDDVESPAELLRSIKELGVRIVLDDFGTGYSSLGYLKDYPLDYIKLDRLFVEAIGEPDGTAAIVEAVIAMAKALKLDVIAEGVERSAQADALAALGCDYAQGYHYARPMAATDAQPFIEQGAI